MQCFNGGPAEARLSTSPLLRGRLTAIRGGRLGPPLGCLLVAVLCLGCAGYRASNVALAHYDPTRGYQPSQPGDFREIGEAAIYLAFSGGGTRAAAFAYGVLEGLRETEVEVGGRRVPLLNEVDTISGVSGGSFPAAYYGLYGDRIFEDFEERFLNRNVQGALVRRALLPWNAVALLTPWLSRSTLASRYYDREIFEGATFETLAQAKGPRIYINGTDLTSGHRFTFTQLQFDIICSDLDAFKISTAVATSSAVPGLLAPITLKNYAGSCGYEMPSWIQAALDRGPGDFRAYAAARMFRQYADREAKKFVHLVDGGVSDNLALRAALDHAQAAGGMAEAEKLMGVSQPPRFVVIVVNALTEPNRKIDLSAASPSLAGLMSAVAGAQIRRYDIETLALLDESIKRWGEDFRKRGIAVDTFLVYLSFELVQDPEERAYLKQLPTSFRLSDEQVERLRRAGRTLLESSSEFQRLVASFR